MPEIKTVGIEEFMALRERLPVFDVRTPAEFAKGHIPGAFNLPLFSDEERRRVGIIYKQIGRESAILEGLEYVGPKMRRIVETVQSITGHKTILLHCWRGGMRSSSVAWLLNTSGYEIFLLKGGYKAFRHYVLDSFEIPRDIIILSGHTGSGKTEILQALSRLGEQAIDLEKLACHKGSAFGSLGETPQPAQQEFENHLALLWRLADPSRPLWLEDESQKIGSRMVPESLWRQMREAKVVFLKMPLEIRVKRLAQEYGAFEKSALRESIERLGSRLGGLNAKTALSALDSGDLERCCEILLRHYYNKTYLHGLSRRDQNLVYTLETATIDPQQNAERLLDFARNFLSVKMAANT